jgi:hypothetical protein
MFRPANPHGEKNALTNITKLPNKLPIRESNIKPRMNVKSEVNSTLGGLGDNCIAKHNAVKMPINAIVRGSLRVCCISVGWIIQPII